MFNGSSTFYPNIPAGTSSRLSSYKAIHVCPRCFDSSAQVTTRPRQLGLGQLGPEKNICKLIKCM